VLQSQNNQNVTTVNVNYLCANNTSSYVKSSAGIFVNPGETHYFTTNSRGNATDCDFDPTGAYVCAGAPPYQPTVSVPPACGFDNTYTLPPRPTINATSNTCDNVVVSVLYNFTWSGQSVLLLNATVVLASIPLSTDGFANLTQFNQEMNVVYVGSESSAATPTNGSGSTRVYPLSGNPGLLLVNLGCFNMQCFTVLTLV